MADAKGAKPLFDKTHFNRTMTMLVMLAVLGALAGRAAFYARVADTFALTALWEFLAAWFLEFWSVWKVIAVILIAVCTVWTIYNLRKLSRIKKEEEKIFGTVPRDVFLPESAGPEEKANEKWLKVLAHARSENPSDWRLAIIEADIMLDEHLRAKGYVGDSVGEMLKSVDPSDMLTLDAAWEAHKVRNRIAHAGAAFQLNERETKRVVALFESVFKEFRII